ncbi:MAG: hypothetical protein COS94_03875 [Candidatus Hydrogenedentes bacterium CG07_land_8_20_14_0_80_42_17]|nr:MAG: hypothetical protein COS94_03875 [Candidatus Hydrogenedentes bacterium CG07_land_8_20_14_0_80_42_17]
MLRVKWFGVIGLLLLCATLGSAATYPISFDFSSSEKTQILQWLNSATTEQMLAIDLSSATAKKVLLLRPYSNWDQMWVTSVGSNTNAKRIAIELGFIQEMYDRYPTKTPLRIRVQDRAAVLNFLNNASVNQMIAATLSSSAQRSIPKYRPYIDWKKALRRVSNPNLKKVAIYLKVLRYKTNSKGIETISGIGAVYGQRMRNIKLFTVGALLMHSVWPDWRAEIAQKVGVSQALVDKWAIRADLQRISGCGEQYGDLLAYCGIKGVPDLATRNATTLRTLMIQTNQQYGGDKFNMVNTMPSKTTIRRWITKAKDTVRYPRFLEGL